MLNNPNYVSMYVSKTASVERKVNVTPAGPKRPQNSPAGSLLLSSKIDLAECLHSARSDENRSGQPVVNSPMRHSLVTMTRRQSVA